MMDGAAINRSLIKEVVTNFGSYTTPNVNEKKAAITYIMDPKLLDLIYKYSHTIYAFIHL